MKLLNKDPEERYQSAYGLLWDLRECKKQLEEAGQITRVPVGRMDDFTRFHLLTKFTAEIMRLTRLRLPIAGFAPEGPKPYW